MPKLGIAFIYGKYPKADKYRVIESVMTVDGYRDRFTNFSFSTYNQARTFISKLKKDTPK